MREQAEAHARRALMPLSGEPPPALAIFDPTFHEGVVGIVASRLKDRVHRPTFVFALGQDGAAEGLGPLDRRLSPARRARPRQQAPSRRAEALRRPCDGGRLHDRAKPTSTPSTRALQQVAREWLDARDAGAHRPAATARSRTSTSTPTTVRALDAQVWGQAFEAPVFCDEVEVVVAAPRRREAPEAHACAAPASSARRSGSAASSRWPSACAWPTASASTRTTAASACRWSCRGRWSTEARHRRAARRCGAAAPACPTIDAAPCLRMNADLHCHSVVSDGTLEPEALAARAQANGVELWALTDHDELGGQQRARDAALDARPALPDRRRDLGHLRRHDGAHRRPGRRPRRRGAARRPRRHARRPRGARAGDGRRARARSASRAPSRARCSTSATPS